MPVIYIQLLDETGTPLIDDEGNFLLLEGESALDEGSGPGGQKGKGQFDNRLWEIYQLEIERRFRPKPKPKVVEPPPEMEEEEPAPTGGFFHAFTDPAEMKFRVRAAEEAKAAQVALNKRTISGLLRKAGR